MKKVGVAILGLGVVGGGVYKILTSHREYFKKSQGLDITVENVLEKNVDRAKELGVPEEAIATCIEEVVSNPAVDVVVEVIGGIGVAKTFVLKALMSGKTVVSSNKELFAKYWPELETAAKKKHAGLFFEATCVGGVPIIRALTESMQANKILSIKGIINGTTNYILTKMANEGMAYEDALKEAQRLGYAEFNPTADVEGFDAMYKLSILSSLAFNTKVSMDNIYREGITKVNVKDIALGKDMGYTLKLLGIGKNTDNGVEVRVHPTFVANSNPLATVSDSFNAVHILGDAVGEIMLYGRGAGDLPTGSAIVSDVIFASKHAEYYYTPFKNDEQGAKETKYVTDFISQYYLRLLVDDKAGILSKFTAIFAKYNVSIKEVKQVLSENGKAEVILITHSCKESSIKKTLDKLKEYDGAIDVCSVIRIEE
jgi:homoserine dehydrogenase